ncbi:MAG: hypothetical protein JWN85_3969 [Gammaproteobacteria bacterium]|nr:hypothetical protein [Gammaproteobacteria bacterium]
MRALAQPRAQSSLPTLADVCRGIPVGGLRGVDPAWDPDSRLLSAIAAGNETALNVIRSRYSRRIGRFALKLTGHHESAQEVANDTLRVIWQRASSFKGDSEVSTWILGIVYRLSMRTLRTNCRWRTSVTAYDRPESYDPWSGGELCEWPAAALSHLPDEQRIVLELFYQLDLSCKEIAFRLKCPVGTVKTRMYQGRLKLRRLLSNDIGD